MRIENRRILGADRLRDPLLHFQNLCARQNQRGLETPNFPGNFLRRNPAFDDLLEIVRHDMNLPLGHPGRDAHAVKASFSLRVAAHAGARLTRLSIATKASGEILERTEYDCFNPR